MADYYQKGHIGRQSRQVPSMTVLSTSLVAIAIGGPLLGLMGFSVFVSTTLLLVCSPLLLLISPLLLRVALLFMVTLAGFVVAAAMALTGLSMFGWIVREIRVSFGGLREMGDSGHRMQGKRGEYLADTTSATTIA